MINRSYKDRNGNISKVKSLDGNIAILEDGNHIAVERLLDGSHYTDVSNSFIVNENVSNVNPPNNLNFFDNPNRFNTLVNQLESKLQNMNVNNLQDDPNGIVYHMDDAVVESRVRKENPTIPVQNVYDDIPVVGTNAVSKSDDLIRKNIEAQKKMQEDLKRQNSQLQKFADPDDIIADLAVDKYTAKPFDPNTQNINEYNNEVQSDHFNAAPIKKQLPKEDTLTKMISTIKRTEKFNISIKLEEMIPNKMFIKMWQDSSEFPIVDYLADEMYNKLMQNPLILKEQIIEKLNLLINKKGKKDD